MTAVDDVKSRLDIVDVVGSRVSLQKAGRNFKANCPFHNEKTPSFIVFPDRGTWHCFGACGTGGDAFSFLQRADNLTFSEALTQLADRAGVTLPDVRRQDEAEQRETDALYTALQNAADYFNRILTYSPAGAAALRYLTERGINEESVKDFHLGMAPSGWEGLKHHLSDLGHSEEQLLAAGLIIPRDDSNRAGESGGGSYDRFRARLMFPVRDVKGRVIGFGARALDDSQPKYLNSPQTPLFDKSGSLFGIDRAQEAIRAEEEVVLVEGYMDAVQAHQSGFRNVVAIMGTALTDKQVGLVRRLARRYALALDPDTAGEEATRRSLEGAWNIFQREIVRGAGARQDLYVRRELPNLRVIALPPGRDPDDVIRDDPDDWRRRVAEATPILDYLIRWEAGRPESVTSEGRLAAVNRIYPLISSLQNPFEQQEAFSKLAAALKIDEQSLEAAVGRPSGRRRERPSNSRAPAASTDIPASALDANRGDALEEHLLALMLKYGDEVSQAWERLGLPDLPIECLWDPVNTELRRVLTAGSAVEQAEAIVSRQAERLKNELPMQLDGRDLGRALSDIVRRLLERQLKREELEASLAVDSLSEEEGGAIRAMSDEMRGQFEVRLEKLRAVQNGKWNRNSRTS